MDFDDRLMLYEVEFVYNSVEYEYDINALDGTIVKTDRDDKATTTDGVISAKEAKDATFKHANIDSKNAKHIECELDNEDGKAVYEISFKVGETEYDYTLDAVTGAVLDAKTEIDD